MWICYSIFIETLCFIREKIYLMIRATSLLGEGLTDTICQKMWYLHLQIAYLGSKRTRYYFSSFGFQIKLSCLFYPHVGGSQFVEQEM